MFTLRVLARLSELGLKPRRPRPFSLQVSLVWLTLRLVHNRLDGRVLFAGNVVPIGRHIDIADLVLKLLSVFLLRLLVLVYAVVKRPRAGLFEKDLRSCIAVSRFGHPHAHPTVILQLDCLIVSLEEFLSEFYSFLRLHLFFSVLDLLLVNN